MLRWWDGEAWSETDFRLAQSPKRTEMWRDLALGPFGLRGSVINVFFCAGLVVAGVAFALNGAPFGWALAAIAVVLDLVFIAIAVVVRRFKISTRIMAYIWPQGR